MKWKVAPKKSDDIIEQLLINRGIKTAKQKAQFFNPKISDFEKDLKIPGIEKANKRIFQAIGKGELIVVFGDYDVDGICASAILYKGLTSIGAKVLPYIPHREKEGYGLNKLGLEFARDSKASVVITVDNGIVAFEQAKFAKSLGLELIITDHHLQQVKLPECYAIVHSTKMCGAAVAWCLVKNIIKTDLKTELLQFVAIATVCDLIPLIGLGRAFVFEGLKILRKTTNLGLLSLISEASIDLKNVSTFEIGHIIGPRLNAIGRLEHAIDALRLLCTKDSAKARKIAKLLCEINVKRQRLTTLAIEQARTLVDEKKSIQVLINSEWSIGIIGLIAGRITDEYYRPSIAISLGKVISKGSARSIDGVNIVEVISKYKDFLIDIGGHPGAAGFSIESKYVGLFKSKLETYILDIPKQTERVLEIEAVVESRKLSRSLITQLQKFEPFGFKNPSPVIATYGMKISDIKTVGNGKHLKLKLNGIDAIAFGMGEWNDQLAFGQIVSVAFVFELNNFNGRSNLQLKVKDIQVV